MKFACDSCDTKYVIPDERVEGKLLRIRCKRCRQVMEVSGAMPPRAVTKPGKISAVRNQDVARHEPLFSAKRSGNWDPFVAAGGSGLFSMGSGKVRLGAATGSGLDARPDVTPPPAPQMAVEMWHVAIRGKARGPFTRDELEVLAARGTIRARSWVWRPGMERWMRLQGVEELATVEAIITRRGTSVTPPAVDGASSDGDSLNLSKEWPPRPVEGQAQAAMPFANLINSHAEWALPPQTPADITSEISTSGTSTGGTGWYALDAAALEELLEDESRHVPGTSAMVTGVHLIHRPIRRIALAVLGGTLLMAVVMALIAVPQLIEMRSAEKVWAKPAERAPVGTTVVDPAHVTPSEHVLGLAGRPTAAPAPAPAAAAPAPTTSAPAKPNLEALKSAMGETAEEMLKKNSKR
ncbi:MAG: GYF domain-containing protein [Myxococcota bacterium]